MTDQLDYHYTFTKNDFLILENYKSVINAMGAILGNTCEIVLHSLHDLNNSIIYIHNGDKTGRKLGSPMTDKGLKLILESERKGLVGLETYFTKNTDGHIMKSSYSVIKNLDNIPIGMLCINFDISTPLSEFAKIVCLKDACNSQESEYFATDIDDLLETTVNKVRHRVMQDERISPRHKLKEIIISLNNQGIFKLRNSVPQIAKMLDISRDVIYLHLRKKNNK